MSQEIIVSDGSKRSLSKIKRLKKLDQNRKRLSATFFEANFRFTIILRHFSQNNAKARIDSSEARLYGTNTKTYHLLEIRSTKKF